MNTARAMGVNIDAYKVVRKWAKMERAKVEQDLRDALLMARILDLGLFDQLDLFSKDHNSALAGLTSKVVTEHKEWEAEREGYEAGKSGDPLDNNPHAAGSAFHERYVIGWHDGNAFRKEAEARGETVIKPRRGGEGNPEDDE